MVRAWEPYAGVAGSGIDAMRVPLPGAIEGKSARDTRRYRPVGSGVLLVSRNGALDVLCGPGGGRERGRAMDVESEAWVQLATRLPKSLHRELKLHCLRAETTMMHFLVVALREKLAKGSRGKRQRTKEPRTSGSPK